MVKRGRPEKEILEELRERMKDPAQIDGCLEWASKLSGRNSTALLRGIVDVLIAHIRTPASRRRGRPSKSVVGITVGSGGELMIKRTSLSLLAGAELKRQTLNKLEDLAIFELVTGYERRYSVTGAIASAAREAKMSEARVRAAYYRVKRLE